MEVGLQSKLGTWLTRWLTRELHEPEHALLYDFDRLCYEIRPGDVILVEGRSRVSDVIKLITQSPWTHATLYIGRFYDIHDDELRAAVREHYDGNPNDPLIVEALLGEGTVVHAIGKYRHEHLRICRPKALSHTDAQTVIAYAIGRLGTDYDVRQLLDLARFMFPFWALLPRRWRSSLFAHNPGQPTRTVCSSMLGAAFGTVHFPVLPFVERTPDGKIHLYKRNPRLFTPRDFDYSPYFEIIKYPVFGLDNVAVYQRLPWGNIDEYCNGIDDCYSPHASGGRSVNALSQDVATNTGFPSAAQTGNTHQEINLRAALLQHSLRDKSDTTTEEQPLPPVPEDERHSA